MPMSRIKPQTGRLWMQMPPRFCTLRFLGPALISDRTLVSQHNTWYFLLTWYGGASCWSAVHACIEFCNLFSQNNTKASVSILLSHPLKIIWETAITGRGQGRPNSVQRKYSGFGGHGNGLCCRTDTNRVCELIKHRSGGNSVFYSGWQ